MWLVRCDLEVTYPTAGAHMGRERPWQRPQRAVDFNTRSLKLHPECGSITDEPPQGLLELCLAH